MRVRKEIEDRIVKLIADNKDIDYRDITLVKRRFKELDFALRRQKDQILEEIIVSCVNQMRFSCSSNEAPNLNGIRVATDDDDFDDDLNENVNRDNGLVCSMNNLLNRGYSQINGPALTSDTQQQQQPMDIVDVPPQIKVVKKRVEDRITSAGTVSRKKSKLSREYTPSSIKFSDLGGINDFVEDIRELIEVPLMHPEIYEHLRIKPPRGILLHGPPGCGKSKLAEAISGELQVPLIKVSAPSVIAGMSGESEKKIRELFDKAKEISPCILFFDEIDAITPKRDSSSKDMERRIVAQLLTCLDDLDDATMPVVVVGATNRPDALDPALRRAGRFDREISLGIPNESARKSILMVMMKNLKLDQAFDFDELAKLTPGYVGADLHALVSGAAVSALKRIFYNMSPKDDTCMSAVERFLKGHPEPLSESEMKDIWLDMCDFLEALKKVQPSSKREGFITVPNVTWSEIGALQSVREELKMNIVEPIRNPKLFAKVGVISPSGVLLWGPPGNGKTLLAKAIANETHCNFISVKGPELLNKYVGESERGVRQLFARARASSPCVIFFDELDALCPKRGANSDSSTSERVVNQLLTELDGLEGRKDVYIIAATNRPDIIDRAMLRPGRFDKLVYVKLPTGEERVEILKTLTKTVPLSESVDLSRIGLNAKCERYSGADLSALVKEASMMALKQHLSNGCEGDDILISNDHFETALSRVHPSVSEKDLKEYDYICKSLR